MMNIKHRFRWVTAAFLAVLVSVLSGCGSGEGADFGNAFSSEPAAMEEEHREQQPYTMQDVRKLRDTKNFAKGALEHIFDGAINKKGKAVGYHYNQIEESKGKILKGTQSRKDSRGIFTAKVEVDGVKKNGFSSFYPESWSPQEVVDSINRAYADALKDPSNPHGSLWIGYDGELEIDMYLNADKKILTAYPIFDGE